MLGLQESPSLIAVYLFYNLNVFVVILLQPPPMVFEHIHR